MWLIRVTILLVAILFIQQINSLKTELVDGNRLYISCSGFDRIEIQSAKWVFRNGFGFDRYNAGQRRAYEQLNIDQTDQIKRLCNNRAKCEKQRQSSRIDRSNLEFHIIYECYPGSCPHRAFVTKHIAPAGKSPIVFAQEAENNRRKFGWQETTFMTIFTGATNVSYARDQSDKTECGFDRAVLKYECKKRTDAWKCDEKGSDWARHKTTTGHYLSKS